MLPNLKVLREERGISQQKLAEIVGVSQPSINKYENHQIEPELEILRRMADYFDTSVDYIIGHTNIRRKIEQTQPQDLSGEEAELVSSYRALTRAQRECINHVMSTLLELV